MNTRLASVLLDRMKRQAENYELPRPERITKAELIYADTSGDGGYEFVVDYETAGGEAVPGRNEFGIPKGPFGVTLFPDDVADVLTAYADEAEPYFVTLQSEDLGMELVGPFEGRDAAVAWTNELLAESDDETLTARVARPSASYPIRIARRG